MIGGVSAFGSLATGWLGGRYPKHILLGLLYILRSVALAAYFVLPPTPATTLLFAAVMGMLWWPGLVPLIGGMVADLFGIRYMATIIGISFVVHQLGSSLGTWGGGLISIFWAPTIAPGRSARPSALPPASSRSWPAGGCGGRTGCTRPRWRRRRLHPIQATLAS